MARTPQQCFEDHLQALGSGNLDRVAADYTDDAIHRFSRDCRAHW